MSRPHSCRGRLPELSPLGDPSDVRETVVRLIRSLGSWHQGFLARGLEDSCQVALVTFEVTPEVDAGGHAHIGVA
jgi:hypothetical protein